MEVASAVPAALLRHPSVRAARLIGSRAEGRAHELSDWDFAIETDDFDAVSRELSRLVEPLEPVAAQWDPFASHACYMLILRGPVKVDLLFLREQRGWSPPWSVTPETLAAVDTHFWDWILWLEQKRRAGRDDVLAASLVHMHTLLLAPMGVEAPSSSVGDAVRTYLAARAELERRFTVRVPRALEDEIRPVLDLGERSDAGASRS